MSIINLDTVESTANVFIRRKVAVVRILEVEPKKSKKTNNDMAVVTFEIVEPEREVTEVVKPDGTVEELVTVIAGKKGLHYVSYGGKGLSMAKEWHSKLGLSMKIDPTDKESFKPWRGLAFEAEIYTDVSSSVDEEGAPVIDPATGEPLSRNSYKIAGLPLRRNVEHTVELPY